MKGMKALLIKDFRLFRSGTGLLSVILPLLVMAALMIGGRGMSGGAFIQPFPVAVRDLDNTVMSNTLEKQIENIDIFSEVIRAKEGQTNQELFELNCAAIITIPEDFFYKTYEMEATQVELVLNQNMSMEASLVKTAFLSVMNIISEEQATYNGMYEFCCEELSDPQKELFKKEASQKLLTDALGRHKIFNGIVEYEDLQKIEENRFIACALSIIFILFPLAAVKTLPEEISSGIFQKYKAAGGGSMALFVSKLAAALIMSLPSMLLLIIFFDREKWITILLMDMLLFFTAFGFFLAVSALIKDSMCVQRWGNIFAIVSLVFGGGLYAGELLPVYAQVLGKVTLTYYIQKGLNAVLIGAGLKTMVSILFPVFLIGVISFFIALIAFKNTIRKSFFERDSGIKEISKNTESNDEELEPCFRSGNRWRVNILFSVALKKIKGMSGGYKEIIILLLVTLLCGYTVGAAVTKETPEQLNLTVATDEDSFQAKELENFLESCDGIAVEKSSVSRGKASLEYGKTEGLLIIGQGYEDALKQGKQLPLTYESASSVVSSQIVREIVAGYVVGKKIQLDSIVNVENKLGRLLNKSEKKLLLAKITAEKENIKPMYTISFEDNLTENSHVYEKDPFLPKQSGFALLAVMLTTMTWSAWMDRRDVRNVENRMISIKNGRRISYISDIMALGAVGVLTGFAAILPGTGTDIWEVISLMAYIFCAASISLGMTRMTMLETRIDGIAPFFALITSMLGGCFGDIGQLSESMRRLSMLTPQGLALHASDGNLISVTALILIAGLGICFSIAWENKGR